MDKWIFLIPLLPFLGFLVNGLLGRRLGDRAVAIIGCASVAGAFAISVASFMQVYDAKPDTFLQQDFGAWIQAGDLQTHLKKGRQTYPCTATNIQNRLTAHGLEQFAHQ